MRMGLITGDHGLYVGFKVSGAQDGADGADDADLVPWLKLSAYVRQEAFCRTRFILDG